MKIGVPFCKHNVDWNYCTICRPTLKVVDKDIFTIKKTKPKKGLPQGAWVCFNKGRNKFRQIFGETPEKAMLNYIIKEEIKKK